MKKIPFLYRMIRGAIGKRFVVKHYKGGRVVMTKFPDMSRIVPSEKQRERRDLFREAVAYAKWIVADAERKRAFRKTLPWKKRKNVYQAAVRLYMRMQGERQWLRKQQWAMGVKRERSNGKGVNGEGSMGNGEFSNWKGTYERMGPWKVIWQKGGLVELESGITAIIPLYLLIP